MLHLTKEMRILILYKTIRMGGESMASYKTDGDNVEFSGNTHYGQYINYSGPRSNWVGEGVNLGHPCSHCSNIPDSGGCRHETNCSIWLAYYRS